MAFKSTQHGLKRHTKDVSGYSLFLGGMNSKRDALLAYDPLKTGYARVFITRLPVFMTKLMASQSKKFKHILEYGFTGVDGIGNVTLDFEAMTGGYAGRQIEVGTTAKDEMNEITIKVYEFAGSPVREFIDTWITGIADVSTGLGHYHGCVYKKDYAKILGQDEDATTPLKYSQANHVMEMIYVQTDPTGASDNIEYACLLTNMIPKSIKKDHFNYTSGQHSIVEMDLTFTCARYESSDINALASRLVQRFSILRDYLDFKSGYEYDDAKGTIRSSLKPGMKEGETASRSHIDIASKSSIQDWDTDGGNITPEKY